MFSYTSLSLGTSPPPSSSPLKGEEIKKDEISPHWGGDEVGLSYPQGGGNVKIGKSVLTWCPDYREKTRVNACLKW